MKALQCTITFVILSIQSFSQGAASWTYSKINKIQFDSYSKVKYLVSDPAIKKHAGKLAIPILEKKPRIFVDDGEFETYKYIGDIPGTKLSLVQCESPNDEVFYSISRLTGKADTLIGLPVFLRNLTDFVCTNNPGTDEKQRIQVCEIKNGEIKIIAYIKAKSDGTVFYDLVYVRQNLIVMKDNFERYWKLDFKIKER